MSKVLLTLLETAAYGFMVGGMPPPELDRVNKVSCWNFLTSGNSDAPLGKTYIVPHSKVLTSGLEPSRKHEP